MKKIVFFDIDGTIIDCSKGMNDISDKVKKSIRELQSQGYYAFIATGRPYAFLSEELLNFGFDGFILTNGAQVIMNNEIIYKSPFNKDFTRKFTKELEDKNLQYILEGEHYSYIKKDSKELRDFYTKDVGLSDKLFKSDFKIDDIDVLKAEIFCNDDDDRNYCMDIINRNPDYDYFSSVDAKTFELYYKENTKASGIMKVLEILNIPIENSYAFGDGKNDIEMLSEVGLGIAMGNASDYVKSFADEITDTVHEDGVAKGIEKFILNSNK